MATRTTQSSQTPENKAAHHENNINAMLPAPMKLRTDPPASKLATVTIQAAQTQTPAVADREKDIPRGLHGET